MQNIEALLLEPVGCLAEFPSAPFHEIAVRFFGRKGKASPSASRSYWHLLNLMQAAESSSAADRKNDSTSKKMIEALEAEAVAAAHIYEDVLPVFAELQSMSIRLYLASSLSREAAAAFVAKGSLGDFFTAVCTRDEAGGVKAAPLLKALHVASVSPDRTMFLTDTLEGVKTARETGVHPILIMNDPDEAQRLSMHNPAGGIVSLHEMPDFIRLIAAQNRKA